MTTQRDKMVSVRFSGPELEQATRAAEREGVRIATWLRRLALVNSQTAPKGGDSR